MSFDPPARRLGVSRGAARLWVCCVVSVSVSCGLSACGGRATDGLHPEANGDESTPGDELMPMDERERTDDVGLVRPVRETCADNPLLAGCLPASTGAGSPSRPMVDDGEGEEPLEELPSYVHSAQNVLAAHCAACHGPALTPAQSSAGINYIDDWDRLIEVGLIERCAPARSRVVVLMRTGNMPPAMSGLLPVPEQDIAAVMEAIELDCADE